ncbi:MAG: OmpA family protein [Pseudomonadota bacterium]
MWRYATFFLALSVIATGVGFCGTWGAEAYQRLLSERVHQGLEVLGVNWMHLRVDGLKVELSGEAPDPDARLLAVRTARATVPNADVTDRTTAVPRPLPPRPPIQLELHRDAEALTLTGQLSSARMQDDLAEQLQTAASDLEFQDLTGTNAAAAPVAWEDMRALIVQSVSGLKTAYLRVSPDTVEITGIAADEAARTALQDRLIASAGDRITLVLDLSVPPDVAIPFRFAAWKDFGGLRVETCAARDEDERVAILATLGRHGLDGHPGACPVALGGPDGPWEQAVAAGLEALDSLPAGSLDLIYQTLHLEAAPPSDQSDFDRTAAELAEALPQEFRLQARLVQTASGQAVPRDAYWLSIGAQAGKIALQGRMPGMAEREALVTFAAALTSRAAVEDALVVAEGPPPSGWHHAAQELLARVAELEDGAAEMTAGRIRLQGRMDDPVEAGEMRRTLLAALPEFEISTRIEIDLPGAIGRMPLVDEACIAELNRLLRDQPLVFETGSAVIDKASMPIVTNLAETFGRCDEIVVEIGGHTDSKGSESLNLRLSQARADAVLAALAGQSVPLDRLSARGYGEAEPIASNQTEAGRARNRRIEFRALE